MKNLLYIIIALCCLSGSKAQSWGHPGSTWTYHYVFSIAGIGGIAQYKLTNVYTVGTKTCQTISGTFTGTIVNISSFSPTVIPNWKVYTTCKSNDVIYYNNDTVVNFNAAKGDKWLRLDQGQLSCNSRKTHVVLDTGHKYINGFNLRFVVDQYTNTVSYGSSNTLTINVIDTIIERVWLGGTGYNGNDMLPLYCDVDNMIAEYPPVFFLCYTDSAFPPHNGRIAGCGNIVGLTENSTRDQLIVSPNPVKDVMRISCQFKNEGPNYFDVYNLYGQLVMKTQATSATNEHMLSVHTLPPGLYFLKFDDSGAHKLARFIKE